VPRSRVLGCEKRVEEDAGEDVRQSGEKEGLLKGCAVQAGGDGVELSRAGGVDHHGGGDNGLRLANRSSLAGRAAKTRPFQVYAHNLSLSRRPSRPSRPSPPPSPRDPQSSPQATLLPPAIRQHFIHQTLSCDNFISLHLSASCISSLSSLVDISAGQAPHSPQPYLPAIPHR